MDFLSYLFNLGILTMLYYWIWQLIVFLPNHFMARIRFDAGVIILNALGLFLYVINASFVTYQETLNHSLALKILYNFICLIIIIFSIIMHLKDKQKEHLTVLNVPSKEIDYDYNIAFGGVLLFIIQAFFPSINIDFITKYYIQFFSWIEGIPILFWVLGIIGAIFLFMITTKVFTLLFILIASSIGEISKNTTRKRTKF